jgi:hypothetical protein
MMLLVLGYMRGSKQRYDQKPFMFLCFTTADKQNNFQMQHVFSLQIP